MKNETALSLSAPTNLRLVALDPAQLQQSQKQLIAWCDQKILSVTEEAEEFRINLDIAKKAKWNTARPKAHLRRAEGQLLFYIKIKDALVAGFYIVPNFPIDIFAIRTDRQIGTGDQDVSTDTYKAVRGMNDSSPDLLEVGAGDYVNPQPGHHTRHQEYKNEKNETRFDNTLVVEGWQDVDFPFVLAKPQVLDATQRAMAQKIFDELGVCPQTKKSDPLVIGVIKAPKRGYQQKQVSFLVAWFLDTDVL